MAYTAEDFWNLIEKTDPFGKLSFTSMEASYLSQISFTMDKPNPLPIVELFVTR